MSDDPHNISLEAVLGAHAEQILDGINTCMPAQIVEYDKDTQRATVQPLVKKSHIQEDDTELVEPLPRIHDVIVMHFGPSRGRITFPVKAGDTCLLFFTSCSIAAWSTGGGGMVDPKDPRRHDISDAVAIVGLHSFGSVPTDAPDDAVVVHAAAGVTVKLGSSGASDGAVRKSDLDALVTGLDARIVALTAGLPATATELASVQAFRDAIPPGWPTASEKTFTD